VAVTWVANVSTRTIVSAVWVPVTVLLEIVVVTVLVPLDREFCR
jgi:hypothetical protein